MLNKYLLYTRHLLPRPFCFCQVAPFVFISCLFPLRVSTPSVANVMSPLSCSLKPCSSLTPSWQMLFFFFFFLMPVSRLLEKNSRADGATLTSDAVASADPSRSLAALVLCPGQLLFLVSKEANSNLHRFSPASIPSLTKPSIPCR